MERRNYFNNTKVANSMMKLKDLTQDFAISEMGKHKSNVFSYITFETDDIQELKSISRFDLMVMDAVYTVLVNGNSRFTLETIANVMVGKEVSLDKNTSTKLNQIRQSIDKLKRIYINIDYTDIMREKRAIGDQEKFIVNGALMPITTYYVLSPVKKRNKIAYEINRKPVLYEYAENLGRIISVPSHVLSLNGVREDTDFIAIKQELIKEIEMMRNKNNNYRSREISYEWENGERSGGFAARVGLFKENYANDTQWRKRKVKLTDQIRTVLDHLVNIEFIQGYSFVKNGKTVTGVAIDI